ncbi:MAG TPA: hypothetical protein ENK05_07455 [Gammaproteobacteria bacterium]|nr:hypothetical protein [Gammaproteobacteria bacterium]
MVSQLSPAWQRRPASSGRPARAHGQIPDGTPENTRDQAPCRAIPFLLDNAGQNRIVRQLAEVLNQRGHSASLYPPEQHPHACSAEELAAQAGLEHGKTEFCLLPFLSPHALQRWPLDHVVLLVPAELDAVLLAYRRIKLLSCTRPPDIGIVMIGPRDQHAAWRYFRKLAVGTLRYLDVPLLNLGFLPQQADSDHSTDDSYRHNFMTRISERLVGSEFCTPLQAGEEDREKP